MCILMLAFHIHVSLSNILLATVRMCPFTSSAGFLPHVSNSLLQTVCFCYWWFWRSSCLDCCWKRCRCSFWWLKVCHTNLIFWNPCRRVVLVKVIVYQGRIGNTWVLHYHQNWQLSRTFQVWSLLFKRPPWGKYALHAWERGVCIVTQKTDGTKLNTILKAVTFGQWVSKAFLKIEMFEKGEACNLLH